MTFQVKEDSEEPTEEERRMTEAIPSTKLAGGHGCSEGDGSRRADDEFDNQREENVKFYEKAKDWLVANYCGRYVVIASAELQGIEDTYDAALTKASTLKQRFSHVMVFKAGDVPFLGTERFRRS